MVYISAHIFIEYKGEGQYPIEGDRLIVPAERREVLVSSQERKFPAEHVRRVVHVSACTHIHANTYTRVHIQYTYMPRIK